MAGRMINGAAALAELIRTAGETDAPGVHRVLPVVPELSGLLPGRGLRRGSTVAVDAAQAVPGGGSTSLMLALLAEASRAGSWCAVVGMPALGVLAAAESGIILERLALVPAPGPDWPTVVAALIDGVDVVVTALPGPVAPTVADRLVARARQRGCVLMPFGHWPGADVTLRITDARWEGLGAGRGRLRRREVTVLARGRGAAARPREVTLWMPGVTLRPPGIPSPSTSTATDPSPGPVADPRSQPAPDRPFRAPTDPRPRSMPGVSSRWVVDSASRSVLEWSPRSVDLPSRSVDSAPWLVGAVGAPAWSGSGLRSTGSFRPAVMPGGAVWSGRRRQRRSLPAAG